jgi:NADPH-dependent ferric siderophore reductase
LVIEEPAASVRLLVPAPGADELQLPRWDGNVFLGPDGNRALIRTFTPRRLDTARRELQLDIVLHGPGAASTWAASARPGLPAAVSGPARGYAGGRGDGPFLLAGDESAIPALSQLLETLSPAAPVEVHVEVSDAVAQVPMPQHPGATINWHTLPEGAPVGDTLVAAVRAARLRPETRVWVAGEAAAVQRIRRHLFEERGLSRTQATVRGYWKHGRRGDDDVAGEDE